MRNALLKSIALLGSIAAGIVIGPGKEPVVAGGAELLVKGQE